MSVELSSSVSSEDWAELKENQDKQSITSFLKHRYEERYFDPMLHNSSKHGFSMMAISCLMIESFISLKKGWKRTNTKGKHVFEEFFQSSSHFEEFHGLGADFYEHIRCGILHQAETTGGWKIRRDLTHKIVCRDQKIIDASKFMKALKHTFYEFLDHLKNQDFTSNDWKKVVKKIDHLVDNCN
ncbi:hypothetical protein EOPP23_20940 [Endozoicomonas sp. OPT23]|uniref:hypothetical protein n=1 Tax=Endozoicomonas sp. OPT23 TaxID=2072845 RepID=UPI00129A61A1|nr:hypothetical protein [Endozoicomonas sp. OPT23]MRI35430.1 hypothetical protein [Endozoicomonas sp. OPT23]